jgi:hypothetical protein
MLLPTTLRIGNAVSLCYEERPNSFTVEVLQTDMVHLSNREHADDPRDLTGIPIDKQCLLENAFKQERNPGVYTLHYHDRVIQILLLTQSDFYWVFIDDNRFKVRYIHELQNLLFYTIHFEFNHSTENVLMNGQ